MKLIDDFLNSITMYRLVLYYLIVLVGIGVIFSFLGVLPFDGISFILSTSFLVAVSWITNKVFSWAFSAPTNVESVYITALILALIISPISSPHGIIFLGWAAVLSMASKYILAIKKKHFLNPAAIAVVLTMYGIGQSASWWVGNLSMLPFVAIGGLLVVRKIRRFSLVIGFLLSAIITIAGFALLKGGDLLATMESTVIYSPLLFFAFVMLTEPLTTPPSKNLQIIYGVLTGILFSPQLRIGGFYTTPETALIIGNIFSYLVSPKEKLLLRLKEKIQLAPDIFDFVFSTDQKFSFTPGQYLEWTLSHENTDNRGNRRYFTLASSPTESDIRIGVKFYENSSSFKKALLSLTSEHPIMAGQLSGDFIMESDPNKKYVFLAGGIGITPFRSIIKNLVDTNSKRDIVLIYSAKTADQFVYQDIFIAAQEKLGIKIIYDLTHSESAPPNWTGKFGRLTGEMITTDVPDYKQRIFYLSGPHSMVTGFEETLKTIGVSGQKIKTDYFPGFV